VIYFYANKLLVKVLFEPFFFRIEYNAFQLVRFDRICNNIVKEEFEDSKSATRSRKTNKERQYKEKR